MNLILMMITVENVTNSSGYDQQCRLYYSVSSTIVTGLKNIDEHNHVYVSLPGVNVKETHTHTHVGSWLVDKKIKEDDTKQGKHKYIHKW